MNQGQVLAEVKASLENPEGTPPPGQLFTRHHPSLQHQQRPPWRGGFLCGDFLEALGVLTVLTL